ncbi:MAG: hypothetical protein AAFQ58_14320 [Pseudomonadota bacterium]
MIRATAIAAALTLTACEEATQAVDDVARRSAKAAVSETLVTRFPAVPKQAVTPFTDCVIDNSTAREIGEFAKDAVIGVSETTVALVRSVLERRETQQCIVQAGIATLSMLSLVVPSGAVATTPKIATKFLFVSTTPPSIRA